MQMQEKNVALALAISSSIFIGISFIVMKKGLIRTQGCGCAAQDYSYLKNSIWWAGTIMLVVGEIGNFAAYAFAPAILVTPLRAISIITEAVLASCLLQERLGILGKLGSTTCLMGALLIVLHAPANENIETIDQLLQYAIQPSFLLYTTLVVVFTATMINKITPAYGLTNPLVFVSICSAIGSISVISTKAFGIALKLTLSGKNQFLQLSTYVFVITMAASILIQIYYFNKALYIFPSNIINNFYYVCFTITTLCASAALFGGLNTSGIVDALSLICGLLLCFAGVYLLQMSRPNIAQHRASCQMD